MNSPLRKLSVLVLFFISVSLLSGLDTISITDLNVSSSNPKYEFIGKGLGELISFEISKSNDVILVERDKRSELIEEMKLSFTGLSDESTQLEIGKLLSVKYLVMGDIIDMDSMLLISVKLIDVESGEVLLKDNVSESLGNYSYISGYFAKSILGFLGADVDTTTVAAAEVKEEKDEEAAIAISNAIDSYDKKDTAAAKKNLAIAKELDPENEVVAIYLQKLSPTSSRYKVQMEIYGPSQNPAVLGIIRQDRIYFSSSAPTDMSEDEMQSVGDDFNMGEQYMASRIGIELPIGERMGVAVEFASGNLDNKIEAPFTFDIFDDVNTYYFHDLERGLGGSASMGYLVNDMFSVGAGVHLYLNQIIGYDGGNSYVYKQNLETAGDLGFLLRARDNSLVFDLHTIVTTQEQYFLDTIAREAKKDSMPLVTEATLTSAFLNRRLFVVLKGLGDIYYSERKGIVARAIPVVEFWPFSFISLRGGYQLTYLNMDDMSDTGHGYVAGTTIRLGKFDLDINFTSRYQPSRVLPGYGKQENFLLIGFSRSGNFKSLSR